MGFEPRSVTVSPLFVHFSPCCVLRRFKALPVRRFSVDANRTHQQTQTNALKKPVLNMAEEPAVGQAKEPSLGKTVVINNGFITIFCPPFCSINPRAWYEICTS
jgi:hypothetical protein